MELLLPDLDHVGLEQDRIEISVETLNELHGLRAAFRRQTEARGNRLLLELGIVQAREKCRFQFFELVSGDVLGCHDGADSAGFDVEAEFLKGRNIR